MTPSSRTPTAAPRENPRYPCLWTSGRYFDSAGSPFGDQSKTSALRRRRRPAWPARRPASPRPRSSRVSSMAAARRSVQRPTCCLLIRSVSGVASRPGGILALTTRSDRHRQTILNVDVWHRRSFYCKWEHGERCHAARGLAIARQVGMRRNRTEDHGHSTARRHLIITIGKWGQKRSQTNRRHGDDAGGIKGNQLRKLIDYGIDRRACSLPNASASLAKGTAEDPLALLPPDAFGSQWKLTSIGNGAVCLRDGRTDALPDRSSLVTVNSHAIEPMRHRERRYERNRDTGLDPQAALRRAQ